MPTTTTVGPVRRRLTRPPNRPVRSPGSHSRWTRPRGLHTLNFHPVSGIKDGGGNVTHVCQYGNVDGSRHFACTFSDWTKFSPCYSTCSVDHDGNGGLTPLSYPFYDYRTTDSKGHNYEVRYWMTDDTGLSKNYRAKRPYLQNSRNNGVLRWTDSPKHLCDLTLSKGDCPTVFRCQASVCY